MVTTAGSRLETMRVTVQRVRFGWGDRQGSRWQEGRGLCVCERARVHASPWGVPVIGVVGNRELCEKQVCASERVCVHVCMWM